VLLLAVASGIRSKLAAQKKPPAKATEIELRTAVRVEAVHRGAYREKLVGYGRARALRRTAVAAEVAGLVTRIAKQLDAGATVKAGEELVWLDDRDSRNRVVTIDAQLSKNTADAERFTVDATNTQRQLELATEELGVAERELDRVTTLVKRGVATSSAQDAERLRVTQRRTVILRLEGDLARNRTQRASNTADRRVLAASREQAITELERCVVRAPYAGHIEARHVQSGARVAPGVVLFELVDRSRVEIPVPLPASRYGDVSVGATARIRMPAGEKRQWSGTVARISPTVSARERTFLVYVESTGESAVPPGAFVVAEIDGRQYEDVIVIPRTAFVNGGVFVATDGIARRRTPKVKREFPSVILCSEGIEDGEEIIVTNLEEVADGARVETRKNG
jgi:multidrug resistance efflux pump